jgi:hypothetical protein
MSTLPPAVEMHTDFPCHLRSVQALERVPRDGLTVDAAGEPHDVAADALDDDEHGVFTWKALGTVVGSMRVIVLFGVSGDFSYVSAMLAVGSSVAVIAAFLIDRRSNAAR